jgi:sugar lactone lactonase YvrE
MGKAKSLVVLGAIGATIAVIFFLNKTKNKTTKTTLIKFITQISVDAKGENVYITDNSINLTVYKFNIASKNVENLGISPNPPFSGPNDIAVDSEGNVYIYDGGALRLDIFDNGNDMFRKIDKDGNVTDFGKLIKPNDIIHPNKIRVDAKGNVYATDSNSLYMINPTTYIAKQIPIEFKYNTYLMDVDDAGYVYLTDYLSSNSSNKFSFYKINISNGKTIKKIETKLPSDFYYAGYDGTIANMKVDTLGENLYFSFYQSKIVYKVNFNSLEINTLATLNDTINSLSTDENKNVYASCNFSEISNSPFIYKIYPSGSLEKIY